jgi:hypothetical protein
MPDGRKENRTGLPDHLKAGIENLSGLALDDVRVHHNSSAPAGVQALAYTQGADIHVGPGQEEHLAHEAWHVVQQKQGRVKPTLQAKGMLISDDEALEQEADVMGAKAASHAKPQALADDTPLPTQLKAFKQKLDDTLKPAEVSPASNQVAQRYFTNDDADYDYGYDFQNHLSDKTGDELKAAALESSRAKGGGHQTLVNQDSLEEGTFTVKSAKSGYDFGLEIDDVEGFSASSRANSTETIDVIVVDGYDKTTRDGDPWYKITHLRAAQ